MLGMPGTGKTAVIVAAVRALLAARRTVLLTSYTNRWRRHAPAVPPLPRAQPCMRA